MKDITINLSAAESQGEAYWRKRCDVVEAALAAKDDRIEQLTADYDRLIPILAAKDAEIAKLRSVITACRNDYRVKASGASPIMHASPFVILELCEKALEEK